MCLLLHLQDPSYSLSCVLCSLINPNRLNICESPVKDCFVLSVPAGTDFCALMCSVVWMQPSRGYEVNLWGFFVLVQPRQNHYWSAWSSVKRLILCSGSWSWICIQILNLLGLSSDAISKVKWKKICINRSKVGLSSMAHIPCKQLAKLSACPAQLNKELLVADWFLIPLEFNGQCCSRMYFGHLC